MKRQQIWLVFRKEFIDLLRDRKTWIGAFVIPIVVIPLLFLLIGSSMSSVEEEARSDIPLAVRGAADHPLIEQLLQQPGTRLVQQSDPLAALQQGEIRAVIQVPDDLEQRLADGDTTQVKLWYDPSNQKSAYARDVVEEAIDQYERQVVAERLERVGLTLQTIQPIETTVESVASDERITGSMLASVIPLMLLLSLASGGIPAATDLVAGEKERGTMEALIASPVSPSSLLTAKLFAVMLMSGVSALASLISLSTVLAFSPLGMEQANFSLGFLQPATIALLLLMLLLLAAFFAGLELAISTMARSFKEAQTYMTPVVFLAMVPAYMLMPINPVDIPLIYYLLPAFNGMAIFKEVFYGVVEPLHALLVVASSLVYVVLVIWLAARFFQKESLLVK
ncbi:ABC transporter permease [Brevibacillus humidisoli]|uniref:ABC transporter permease n=1 Tax=Brevibacillus humidisoli TaxID=2895522 RepID=UPI001E3F1633|nr:ABC transporter permease [Brevibacillus humidisoli]UFJ41066.1 ABC transporter permease [Brevibacillus humidisoli]